MLFAFVARFTVGPFFGWLDGSCMIDRWQRTWWRIRCDWCPWEHNRQNRWSSCFQVKCSFRWDQRSRRFFYNRRTTACLREHHYRLVCISSRVFIPPIKAIKNPIRSIHWSDSFSLADQPRYVGRRDKRETFKENISPTILHPFSKDVRCWILSNSTTQEQSLHLSVF